MPDPPSNASPTELSSWDSADFEAPVLKEPEPGHSVAGETSDEDSDGYVRPKFGEGRCGRGPPLKTDFLGKFADFKDGCGLCSPGRWSPGDRQEAPQFLRILRGKLLRVMREHFDLREVVFKLAAGRYDACPFHRRPSIRTGI